MGGGGGGQYEAVAIKLTEGLCRRLLVDAAKTCAHTHIHTLDTQLSSSHYIVRFCTIVSLTQRSVLAAVVGVVVD